MKRIVPMLLSVIAVLMLLRGTGYGQSLAFTTPVIMTHPVPTGYVYGMTPAFMNYYASGANYNYYGGPQNETMVVSEDGLGGAVMVHQIYYSYNSSTGVSLYYYIWAQRIDKNGNLMWGGNNGIWPAIPIGSYGTQPQQYNPHIVGDGIGGAYIGWNGYDFNLGRWRVYMQHVGPTGTLLWGQNGYCISNLLATTEYSYYYYKVNEINIERDNYGAGVQAGVYVTFNVYTSANSYGVTCACRITGDNGSGPKFGWTGGLVTLQTWSSTEYTSSSTSPASYLSEPMIRGDNAGGAWIVTACYGTSTTPYYRLRVYKVDATGKIVSNAYYTDLWYSSYYPYYYNSFSVVRDGSGGVNVVYGFYYDYATAAYYSQSNKYYYYGRDWMHLTLSGTSILRNGPLMAGSPNDVYSTYYMYYNYIASKFCADSAGGIYKSWTTYYTPSGTYDYSQHTQRFSGTNLAALWNTTGQPSGTAMESTTGTGIEFANNMCDPGGSLISAWMYASYSYSSSNPIYINKMKQSDGTKMWGSGYLQISQAQGYYNSNQYYMYYQSYPYLCSDGAGGAWVVWNGYMNDYTNGSYTNFYLLANHVVDTSAAPHAAAGAAANVGSSRVGVLSAPFTGAAVAKSYAGSQPSIQSAVTITGYSSYKGWATLSNATFPKTIPMVNGVGSLAFDVVARAPYNGPWQDSIRFNTNDPAHPTVAVAVNGNGIYPHLTASDTCNMPGYHVGTTYTRTFTIQNTGTDYLTITGANITGSDASNFGVVGSPNQTINAGASGTITVSFTPSTAVPKVANLNINSDDSQYVIFSKPKVVQLAGTGIYPHITALNTVQFPNTVVSLRTSTRSLVITNTGTDNLIITPAPTTTITGTNASEFSIVSLPTSIPPGQTANVTLKFSPNAVLNPADRTALLNLYANYDSNSTCGSYPCSNFQVSLFGTGVDGAPDMVYTEPINMGNVHVGKNKTVTFHIANTTNGTKVLAISSYGLVGPYARDFQILNVPAKLPDTIAIGGSRDLQIQWTANNVATELAYLRMTTNVQAPPVDVSMIGVGAKAALRADVLDFGNVAKDTCKDGYLHMTNYGNDVLVISSFTLQGASALAYTIQGSTNLTLQPFASANIKVTFCPTSTGNMNVLARIITSDGDTNYVSVNGKGVNNGALQAADVNFGLVAIQQTLTHKLHVENVGEIPVNIEGVSFTSPTAPIPFTTDLKTPALVPPGDGIDVNVMYMSNTAGDASANMVFATDIGAGVTVHLTGSSSADPFAAAPQVISNTLTSMQVVQNTIILRNFSNGPTTVMKLEIVGHDANAFRLNYPLSWPFDVSALSTDSIIVSFVPTAPGQYVATLEITMGDGKIIRIALNGTLSITDVRSDEPVPQVYGLSQNFPNPFTGGTTISYSLPERAPVTLTVFDVMGRVVRELVNGPREAGVYNVNVSGDGLAAGLYTYELRVNGTVHTHVMQVVK